MSFDLLVIRERRLGLLDVCEVSLPQVNVQHFHQRPLEELKTYSIVRQLLRTFVTLGRELG